MTKLAIVSSKKYLKSKQAALLISYLDKQKIYYEKILVDSEIENIKSEKVFDLIISVGGDGTALKAMALGWNQSVPVLNLGSGRVGYLVNSFDSIDFDSIINENFKNFKNRTPIIQNNDEFQPAFNEIVLIKNAPTRMLDMQIETYNQKVKLRADGLIISSSLGSTAYNYSAGGPIVQTSIDSLIITPISPFTKFPRSIVLDNKSDIKITIFKNQDFSIQFDGAEVIEGNEQQNRIYDYRLSKNKLKVLEVSDNPKLDHFLNQILR
jgi:NAD+ kinase